MLTALQVLKEELKHARETFESTANDIAEEHLHKDLGGLSHPLGATYAHLVFSEDVIVQGMLQGKSPLYETTWKDKTGASEPMPAMDDHWSENNTKWGKSVQINFPQMKEYAKAVFDTTAQYVDSLKEEDLEKEIDLGSWGKKPLVHMLYAFLIGHTYSLAGEISALKGVNGAKGYPF